MCKCIRIGIFCFGFDVKKNTRRHRMRNPFSAKTNKVFSGVVCTSGAAPIDRSNDNNHSNTAATTISTAIPIDCSSDNKNKSTVVVLLQQHQLIASTATTSSAATAFFVGRLYHRRSNIIGPPPQTFNKKQPNHLFQGGFVTATATTINHQQ